VSTEFVEIATSECYSTAPTELITLCDRNAVNIRGAVTKFPELWYSTVMVGHMTTVT